MTHEVPDIVTPCCGFPLNIHTTYTGGYLGSDVPNEIVCDGQGCYNSWTPEGESDEYNVMPKGAEEA